MSLNINFDNNLHKIWGYFFEALHWNWKYYNGKDNLHNFVISTGTGIDNLKVKIFECSTVYDLSNCISKINFNDNILLLGDKILNNKEGQIGIYLNEKKEIKKFIIPLEKINSPSSRTLKIENIWNLCSKIISLQTSDIEDTKIFSEYMHEEFFSATCNSHYVKLTIHDDRYYIWFNKKYNVWLMIGSIKLNDYIRIRNGFHQYFFQTIDSLLDDIIKTNNKNLIDYEYELLWSDCGHVEITDDFICPYGNVTEILNTITKDRKNVDLSTLKRDLLQLAVDNRFK